MGKAGRKLRGAGCVSGSVSSGEVVPDQVQMDGWTGHTQHSLQQEGEEQNSSWPGPGSRLLAERGRRALLDWQSQPWIGSAELLDRVPG